LSLGVCNLHIIVNSLLRTKRAHFSSLHSLAVSFPTDPARYP